MLVDRRRSIVLLVRVWPRASFPLQFLCGRYNKPIYSILYIRRGNIIKYYIIQTLNSLNRTRRSYTRSIHCITRTRIRIATLIIICFRLILFYQLRPGLRGRFYFVFLFFIFFFPFFSLFPPFPPTFHNATCANARARIINNVLLTGNWFRTVGQQFFSIKTDMIYYYYYYTIFVIF